MSPKAPEHALTPRQLRAFGEGAEGMPRKRLVVLRNAEGKCELKEDKPGQPGEVVMRIYADPEVEDRPGPVGLTVRMKTSSGRDEDLVDRFDAIFWSEAAVRKFVFSYYHGMRVLTAAGMAKLEAAYQDKDVVVFAHTPKTETQYLENPDRILDNLWAYTTRDMGGTGRGARQWVRVSDY